MMAHGKVFLISVVNLLKTQTGLLGLLCLVLLWLGLASTGWIGKTLIASPGEVIETIGHAFVDDALLADKFHVHAFHTLRRALDGWGLGIGLGIALGLSLGGLLPLYKASEPAVEFFRAIPPVLAFPLLLVAFNYGESAYIWTIVFGCLPIMTLAVARGTLAVSRDRLDILRSFGVARTVRVFATSMEIVPSVFLGARITLSVAIIISVVTEMVFTPRSGLALGALARDSEIDFNTPMFYTCVFTIGLFGYLANLMMRKIEQWLGFAEQSTKS